MGEEESQDLADRLAEDAELRAQFRDSPADVVEEAGIELDYEQRAKLEAEDWSAISDEELIERLSGRGWAAWW
ncbi:MAG TPA: hypothetical protein VMU39_09010 [Solirubrobacteraceae bacterium]|nr:hypothetical protein [Solirubrobacteraceae bacterium]